MILFKLPIDEAAAWREAMGAVNTVFKTTVMNINGARMTDDFKFLAEIEDDTRVLSTAIMAVKHPLLKKRIDWKLRLLSVE